MEGSDLCGSKTLVEFSYCGTVYEMHGILGHDAVLYWARDNLG